MFWITLSIMVTIGLFGLLGLGNDVVEGQYGQDRVRRWRLRKKQVFALFGLLIMILGCITFIPANTVGILYSPITGVRDTAIPEGMSFKGPFDTIYLMSTEIQNRQIDNLVGQTKDSQYLMMQFNVKYRILPENAVKVFRQFKNIENVNSILMPQVVQRGTTDVTTKYNIIDALGQKQTEIYKEVEQNISNELADTGVTFFSITITDWDAGEEIERAIQDEAVAKKQAETAKQTYEKAKIDAETAKLEANNKAEIIKINAAAEAEANRIIAASLTEPLIKMMEMEARKEHGWVQVQGGTAIVDTREK